jgi:hypothetical protein
MTRGVDEWNTRRLIELALVPKHRHGAQPIVSRHCGHDPGRDKKHAKVSTLHGALNKQHYSLGKNKRHDQRYLHTDL